MHDTGGMRERLVRAAVRLLGEEGPAALQARRLAREVDASTMAVYHYFGGMPQLLAAVIEDGFRRLDERLGQLAESDDPVADLARLAAIYRSAARENPHLYDLMFGLSAPGGHRPDSRGGSPGVAAYRHLVTAAGRAIDAGRLRRDDAEHVAAQLWSALHGYISLELAGHFDRLDGPARVFRPAGINLLIGLGDDPQRAAASAARAAEAG